MCSECEYYTLPSTYTFSVQDTTYSDDSSRETTTSRKGISIGAGVNESSSKSPTATLGKRIVLDPPKIEGQLFYVQTVCSYLLQ